MQHEESDYERDIKKQESLKILYGNKYNRTDNEQPKQYVFNEAPPTYFVDENGITKKYINTNTGVQRTQAINRTNNIYNSSDFDDIIAKGNKNKPANIEKEHNIDPFGHLTEEEIEIRNKRFLEKFDNIADSHMINTNNIDDYSNEDQSEYVEEYESNSRGVYRDDDYTGVYFPETIASSAKSFFVLISAAINSVLLITPPVIALK